MIDLNSTPARYRGTIEVYDVRSLGWPYDPETPEWRWRCKSRNGQILASGEKYRRKGGALNAIDATFGSKLTGHGIDWDRMTAGPPPRRQFVVPWRLVIVDRHHDTTTGAVY
ncbi:YegP family protein [Gordonia sp. AC31]|uniref:YegP family protein n=1 Tax=Gordonia sp. AC31 TaxID=2962571 RepID=UPI002880EA40|nr:YegP family protein [Gordonia sp. AC31]MDT0223494.1 YegP family protein [Gordonia sp. AC31]